MNTLKIESELARQYSYAQLSSELSKKYRKLFNENIPCFLKLTGDSIPLFSNNNTKICEGYKRIVVGDYGAFIEFDVLQSNHSVFVVKPGQEYRIHDPKYSKKVKYEWYTVEDGSDIKIYKQKRSVTYADYKSKMYYVSVHEVKENR